MSKAKYFFKNILIILAIMGIILDIVCGIADVSWDVIHLIESGIGLDFVLLLCLTE